MTRIILIHALVIITCVAALLNSSCAAADVPIPDMTKIKQIIETQAQVLVDAQINGTMWNYPSFLGQNFISEYLVVSKWLDLQTVLDEQILVKQLLDTQMTDGSWQNVVQANIPHGDIDSTLFNYWALKATGLDINSTPLAKARAFILKSGGIEKTMTMTKFWLALFNNYSWDKLPVIPLFAFEEGWIQKFFDLRLEVSQWVYPHLIGMAYLRDLKLHRDMPSEFLLAELYTGNEDDTEIKVQQSALNAQLLGLGNAGHQRDNQLLSGDCNGGLLHVIDRLMAIQQPRGSFGGYTVSSLFAIIALKDYQARCPGNKWADQIPKSIEAAHHFIEWMYFQSGSGAYQGVLDDGHYWDTALVAGALAEAMESGFVDSSATSRYLVASSNGAAYLADQQKVTGNGGIPFGVDFWYAPDVDDTAEAVTMWHHLGSGFDAPREKAIDWLRHMQNKDGGWGAFDKNRDGEGVLGWMVKKMAGAFANSAEIFDPSSNDVSAHIMEGFGNSGIKIGDPTVDAAVKYFHKTQQPDGSWVGRWGCNYLYGTGAVIVGLSRVGVEVSTPTITNALDWIASKQNQDGGWGESTLSYIDSSWAGKGISTASQTAWALLGLLEGYKADKTNAKYADTVARGVNYLVASYPWVDASAVGTGHPRILYMQYPSYAQAFPLIALERYAGYEMQM